MNQETTLKTLISCINKGLESFKTYLEVIMGNEDKKYITYIRSDEDSLEFALFHLKFIIYSEVDVQKQNVLFKTYRLIKSESVYGQHTLKHISEMDFFGDIYGEFDFVVPKTYKRYDRDIEVPRMTTIDDIYIEQLLNFI